MRKAIILVIFSILIPTTLSVPRSWSPCVIGQTVQTADYVEYWKARFFHGDYINEYDKGKWWFERDGHRIEYRRK